MELLKALVVALTNTDLMSRTANGVICFVFTFQFRLWFALVIGLNFTFFVVKALRILQQQNSRSVFLFLTIVAENRGEARFLILRFVHKVVNGNFLLTTMTSCLVNIEDDCFLKSITLGHWLFESSVKSFLKTLLLRVRFHINVDGLDHDVDRFACRSCQDNLLTRNRVIRHNCVVGNIFLINCLFKPIFIIVWGLELTESPGTLNSKETHPKWFYGASVWLLLNDILGDAIGRSNLVNSISMSQSIIEISIVTVTV